MNQKTEKNYIDTSFGFPVSISQVTLFKEDTDWIADINYQQLKKIVLKHLILRKYALNGKQLNFVRLCTELEIDDFCRKFDLPKTHVLRWKTDMHAELRNWKTEKQLRLFVVKEILKDPKGQSEAFAWLEQTDKVLNCISAPLSVSLEERIK